MMQGTGLHNMGMNNFVSPHNMPHSGYYPSNYQNPMMIGHPQPHPGMGGYPQPYGYPYMPNHTMPGMMNPGYMNQMNPMNPIYYPQQVPYEQTELLGRKKIRSDKDQHRSKSKSSMKSDAEQLRNDLLNQKTGDSNNKYRDKSESPS